MVLLALDAVWKLSSTSGWPIRSFDGKFVWLSRLFGLVPCSIFGKLLCYFAGFCMHRFMVKLLASSCGYGACWLYLGCGLNSIPLFAVNGFHCVITVCLSGSLRFLFKLPFVGICLWLSAFSQYGTGLGWKHRASQARVLNLKQVTKPVYASIWLFI